MICFIKHHSTLKGLSILGSVALAAYGSAQTFTTWPDNGHQYAVVLVGQDGTWTDANNGAISLGGHLATITSVEENDFIFSLIDDPAYWVSQGGAWNFGPWFGLVQAPGGGEPAGGWEWVTGETFSFSNWDVQSNEPNNSPPNENVAHFHAIGSSHQSYWNDLQGDWPIRPNSYVVEIDSVPEPTGPVALSLGLIAILGKRRRA